MNTVKVACDLGARLLVPQLAETWWCFSLSLIFPLLCALTHVTHYYSAPTGCIHCSQSVHSSLICFYCDIIEVGLWWYLQTQYCTMQPSLVTEGCQRSNVVPKAGLGSNVHASMESFSLWTRPISELNWNSQPLSIWGLCFRQGSVFFYQNKWS